MMSIHYRQTVITETGHLPRWHKAWLFQNEDVPLLIQFTHIFGQNWTFLEVFGQCAHIAIFVEEVVLTG